MYVFDYVCMSPFMSLNQFIGFLFYFVTMSIEPCKIGEMIAWETIFCSKITYAFLETTHSIHVMSENFQVTEILIQAH
jgi:hypothetical protein